MTTPTTVIARYLAASPYKPHKAMLQLSGMWHVKDRYRISCTLTGDTVQSTVRELERFAAVEVEAALDAALNAPRLAELRPGDRITVAGADCEVGENGGGVLTLVVRG